MVGGQELKTLRETGETAAIDRLAGLLSVPGDVVVGAGDDCAVVRCAGSPTTDLLLTSDPVIRDVHFGPDTPPARIGHKGIGRVLSDLAAMGGDPCWGLVNIVAPGSTPMDFLDELYRGAGELAQRHGFAVVGGDLSEGATLEMHVFGLGTVPTGRALLRSGAVPGDALFVSGSLGGSRAGRHLTFEPRVAQGIWLREWASSLIDLSDGIATDLRRLVRAAGVGCDLEPERVPVAAAAQAVDGASAALEHALSDGEDFELLFTVPSSRSGGMLNAWHDSFDLCCTRIGTITDRKDKIRCLLPDGSSRPLDSEGFTHFKAH